MVIQIVPSAQHGGDIMHDVKHVAVGRTLESWDPRLSSCSMKERRLRTCDAGDVVAFKLADTLSELWGCGLVARRKVLSRYPHDIILLGFSKTFDKEPELAGVVNDDSLSIIEVQNTSDVSICTNPNWRVLGKWPGFHRDDWPVFPWLSATNKLDVLDIDHPQVNLRIEASCIPAKDWKHYDFRVAVVNPDAMRWAIPRMLACGEAAPYYTKTKHTAWKRNKNAIWEAVLAKTTKKDMLEVKKVLAALEERKQAESADDE